MYLVHFCDYDNSILLQENARLHTISVRCPRKKQDCFFSNAQQKIIKALLNIAVNRLYL